MTSGATIKGLREALDPHFDGVQTTLRRLREAGLLPPGRPGRDGASSAEVEPRDAALVLLALASQAWVDPVDCPAEAQRLASFRLRQPGTDAVTLLDCLAGELRATAGRIANHTPSPWRIGETFTIRESDPRLRFIAIDTPAGQLLINRQTVIDAQLIAEVGSIFRPIGAVGAAAELERA